jgi:tRNA modification GTPase
LLNRLAGREAAIVSEEAGTTRDVLEVRLVLGGVPVTLADTAGLREAAGAIEAEGVRRALARAESADLRIVVGASDAGEVDFSHFQAGDIKLLNKVDVSGRKLAGALSVSARSGEGIDELVAELTRLVTQRYAVSERPQITRARHREGLVLCDAHLLAAASGIDRGLESVLVAEELRLAMRALGRITGRVDVEDLLDVVFRDFCIGK